MDVVILGVEEEGEMIEVVGVDIEDVDVGEFKETMMMKIAMTVLALRKDRKNKRKRKIKIMLLSNPQGQISHGVKSQPLHLLACLS